jgi:hypothetical protein
VGCLDAGVCRAGWYSRRVRVSAERGRVQGLGRAEADLGPGAVSDVVLPGAIPSAALGRPGQGQLHALAPVPLPPVVPCPGLACLACGNPVGCQRLHRTAWAWAHLGVQPVGCPGLLVPAADLVYLVHLLPAYRHARHYLGKAASSGLLKAVWQVSGDEFAELA